MTLDELIRTVETEASSDHPLDRLSAAMVVKADVDDLTDSLIGHFVDQARRSGLSWSQIGGAMGVSKQAAQQKHASERPQKGPWPLGQRFTDRARAVVEEAKSEAVELGHGYVGTEHLLLGILAVPRCLAAESLASFGFGEDQVLAVVEDAQPRQRVKLRRLPFTPKAKKTMELSLGNALRLGHNYIGTEHLLLAQFDVDGLGAKALTTAGLTKTEVERDVVRRLAAAS